MRVAIYGRVSTIGQGQSPEMQLVELREFAARRGWEIAAEFTDAGVSGARERRPALDRLMADCRKRRFDAVLVYRYDRFARSLRHLVNALDEFNALGISFVSLHEGVDTTTPNGRLIFGIFASIAEFERELIRQRVLSGLALARARGVKLGRPRLTVDTNQIAALRAQGASWRTVCKKTGLNPRNSATSLPAASQNRCSIVLGALVRSPLPEFLELFPLIRYHEWRAPNINAKTDTEMDPIPIFGRRGYSTIEAIQNEATCRKSARRISKGRAQKDCGRDDSNLTRESHARR